MTSWVIIMNNQLIIYKTRFPDKIIIINKIHYLQTTTTFFWFFLIKISYSYLTHNYSNRNLNSFVSVAVPMLLP